MTASIRILLVALLSLTFAAPARAHPHVWVTMNTELVYAPDGTITGVRQAWAFDDMFSAFAVQGLESKVKEKFTREELAPLAKDQRRVAERVRLFHLCHRRWREGAADRSRAGLLA